MYWAFKTQEEVRDGQTSENSPYCANIRSSAPRSFTLHMCFTKLLLALLQTQPRDEVHKSGSNSKTSSKVHSSLVTCYRYIDRFLPNSRFFHSILRIYVLIFSLSKTTKFQKAYSKPFQKKNPKPKSFRKYYLQVRHKLTVILTLCLPLKMCLFYILLSRTQLTTL